MVTSSIFEFLKNKSFKLKVENKTNPYKFSYKNNKFSICIKNIGFAYRTNMDEYRVQIGENMRKKLKEYHLQGYWALIIGYHKNSKTYVAWIINFYLVLEQRIGPFIQEIVFAIEQQKQVLSTTDTKII